LAGNKINTNLTEKEEIPKNSAMPPQTPDIDLSDDDFLNGFLNAIPLSIETYYG
jgi:hypothetical protein